MASFGSEIIVRTERRPVWLKDGAKGIFLCWNNRAEIVPPSVMVGGHSGGVISGALAVVELENGSVIEQYPTDIKFADGGDFRETYWKENKED